MCMVTAQLHISYKVYRRKHQSVEWICQLCCSQLACCLWINILLDKTLTTIASNLPTKIYTATCSYGIGYNYSYYNFHCSCISIENIKLLHEVMIMVQEQVRLHGYIYIQLVLLTFTSRLIFLLTLTSGVQLCSYQLALFC